MGSQGIKDLALRRSDIYHLDPRELCVKPGWNCRDIDFDPNDPEDLAFAKSVANGVKEALTVTWEDGKPYITNGHRRRAAALYAIETLGVEIKSVPVQTEDRYGSEADHVYSQIVRNSGKNLKPYEKARAFKRLIDLGWTESDIATKSGLNRAWVIELLELQSAPAALTDLVRSGKVAATLAIDTLKKNKGDGKKSTRELNKAVAKAEGEGKTRATAKHMGGPKPIGLKAQLKEIFAAAKIEDMGVYFSVELTPDQHDTLKDLIGF
jgi:ParB family chromosome partitioning protein